MDLKLTEEQELIKSSVRNFLKKECPSTLVRALEEDPQGYSPKLWKQMADLGWMGICFPTQYGGTGMSFQDLCIVIEERGFFRLLDPFLSTVVLCGLAIERFGTEAQKSEYLPDIASGSRIMTYAELEDGATWGSSRVETTAQAEVGGYVLNGTKLFVPYAHVADDLLVVARTSGSSEDGVTLFLVDAREPGVSFEPLETIGSDHQQKLTFENVRVAEEKILGPKEEGRTIAGAVNQWGTAAKCAEMVGGAQRVLEMTLEYAKQREQFGRPIGSFQAVQHHLANMAIDVLSSRFIAYRAVWSVSQGMDASEEVSVAKAWVSDAYQRVCALGHQVHGAIGFTREYDLQLFYRHAKAADLAFGDGDYHRELVALQLGL